MRPLFLLFILTLVGSQGLCAQTFLVSGEVKNAQNNTIPFANVFVLRISDTTIVKGASADENGKFTIQNVPPNVYYLRASYIGKTSKLLGIDISADVVIGALIIDREIEMLDEVVVTSNRPVVERKVDRLVFNVENTVLSQGSSWEILQRTPGVIVLQDQLQIRNQAATVYINDRKVQLSSFEVKELLENYQGQYIKSVEVIGNPPAKYDAEGGPILNIVTSKNISLGYKGNVSTNYTQAVFPKYSFGTSHFYKTKKLNLHASYLFSPRKDFKTTSSETNFIDGTGIFSRWATAFDRTSRFRSHSANLSLDYEFDERNELNVTSSAQLSPYRKFNNFQTTDIRNGAGVLDSIFTTDSNLDEDRKNLSGDITFKHRFKQKGQIQVNGHYTKFNLDRTQDASSNYFDPNDVFIRNFSFSTDAAQDIEIFTSQLDVSTMAGSTRIETGLKGSFINSESGLNYFTVLNSARTLDPSLSDNYLYDEDVYAAYLSIANDWDKWSLKTGLRAEHTISSGTSVALATINRLEYFELFPTLNILFTPSINHSFAFDYSRKLTRPRYEDLNPFRYFINENNFTDGNPDLVPNFSNNFNLNYTLNQEFFFDFYYRDNGKYISTLGFQDNENLTLRDITQNVLESTSYGFDFNYGKAITKWLYLYSYISIFHEDETFLALESNNQIATNNVDGYYIDLTNYLSLSKDGTFKGEVKFTHLSGFLQGSYKQEETSNLSIGLRKSFWNKKMLMSLTADDIFNTANSAVTSRYLNQDNSFFARTETRYVRLGLTYNFGNFRLVDNQRDIDKIERDRIKEE
ncbi:outer membrane beta-barrel protein [Spongiimicrobium sp. 3-5]|uniref:outer membrane beta-barrel protein n=1 Tax=Spongiimicrobium sp. 3-5 TaxID=3332596 RepID=UPI0039814962